MSESTVEITCRIDTTDPSAHLGIEILLNNQLLLDIEHVSNPIDFKHNISDDDREHELTFVLKNKTSEHTVIDSNGAIIKDAGLLVSNLSFDEIALNQIFINQSTYTHNFNGNGETVQDKFYGEMGCNGAVTLKFSTPVYLWLLENM